MDMSHCQTESEDGRETRCACGQLVAKLRPDGVELKCKRCKRLVLVPYASWEETQIGV